MRIRKLITKAQRKLIQLIYGFDKWHISPLSERPYARDVIAYSNNRSERNNFVEIGCGLGDIIRNVDYVTRAGYDNDSKVLKAARALPSKTRTGKRVKYSVFNFPETALSGTSDVITMVNWIHHIEPVVLKKNIEQYFRENLKPGGEILVDTVQDKAYRYNHNIEFLTGGIDCSVFRIGEYSRQREVWAIKKKI
ncbi:MAG: class I SAM-dependent methyltransferase [Chitinophagaceae bacterium]|nr:MAG: class I SAM-dependent methyltransferase [Chitinophagaceae bacterium]